MSKITREEVLHVANLARLALSEDEVDRYARQLDDILTYADKLNELDTAGAEPMAHVIPLETAFREDRTTPSLEVDESLSNAPDRSGNFFKVPKII
ncbi:MAG: Asp-tRNA(Asn)/Glu-tRNA(Gln) amidotransferase subunit GatC [Deltaproteobacteria bacterium]|nr:Asp-tRNA(Asn)/Glu-tRNA(Gln) amidotransferase subunit GatC [Deltaproteobacteria bacterium]